MTPRPHYAQPGCVYFICLLRDDLLLRQGAYTRAGPTFPRSRTVCRPHSTVTTQPCVATEYS